MKIALWTSVLIAVQIAVAPALAADDTSIERMATCRDSWLDWQKSNPAPLKAFGEHFQPAFAPHGDDAFLVPKASASILGLRVLRVFPNSIGMGVGFSVVVDAPFDKARKSLETSLGKKLAKCETSDNMRSCELELGEKRTLMLMAEDDPKSTQTWLGCYYYYEK